MANEKRAQMVADAIRDYVRPRSSSGETAPITIRAEDVRLSKAGIKRAFVSEYALVDFLKDEFGAVFGKLPFGWSYGVRGAVTIEVVRPDHGPKVV